MLKKLIQEGISLEKEVNEDMGLKYFESVKFETWMSKCILYLERNKSDSSLTSKVVDKNKKLTKMNNFEFYHFLLGTLQAMKELEDDETIVI